MPRNRITRPLPRSSTGTPMRANASSSLSPSCAITTGRFTQDRDEAASNRSTRFSRSRIRRPPWRGNRFEHDDESARLDVGSRQNVLCPLSDRHVQNHCGAVRYVVLQRLDASIKVAHRHSGVETNRIGRFQTSASPTSRCAGATVLANACSDLSPSRRITTGRLQSAGAESASRACSRCSRFRIGEFWNGISRSRLRRCT